YERQLRVYAAEDKFGLQQRLVDAQKRIADLEDELANHTADTPALDGADGIHDVVSSDQADGQLPLADPDVELLKRKARQLQYMLDDHIKTGDAK
ncbi:MAG: hypothetical protein K2K67_10805, partial [Treponemataceae bacterium]|nr:hypothetical protein [Treponemataceae bacterium]